MMRYKRTLETDIFVVRETKYINNYRYVFLWSHSEKVKNKTTELKNTENCYFIFRSKSYIEPVMSNGFIFKHMNEITIKVEAALNFSIRDTLQSGLNSINKGKSTTYTRPMQTQKTSQNRMLQ